MPNYQNQQVKKVDNEPVKQVIRSKEEIDFKRAQNKERLNDCQRRVYDRAQAYKARYGEDDFRTEILVNFLVVSEFLEDIIEMQETFQDVEILFNDAMMIMDDNLLFSEQMTQQQLSTNYGFFARMKQRRLIKKAQRNNANRIKAMIFRINSTMNTSISMSTEMKKAMLSMRSSFENAKKLNEKLDKKGKGIGRSESNEAILNKYAKRFNDEENISNEPVNNTKPSSTNSGSDSNIDDIA